MERKDSIVVLRTWMAPKLGLSGNKLFVASIVYNFSGETEEGENRLVGGAKYIASVLYISVRQAATILRSLVADGIICERTEQYKSGYRKTYCFNFGCLADEEKEIISTPENDEPKRKSFPPQKGNNFHPKKEIISDSLPYIMAGTGGSNSVEGIDDTDTSEAEIPCSKKWGITAEGLGVRPQVIKKMDGYFKRLVFPFDSDEFKRNFYVLCCTKNWRGKEISSIQKQLKLVGKYTEPFVMQLIDTSIANDWKALVYDSTDKKFEEFKRNVPSYGTPGGVRVSAPTQEQLENERAWERIVRESME